MSVLGKRARDNEQANGEYLTPPSDPSPKGESLQEADDDDIGPMPMLDAARKKRKGTWPSPNPDLSSQ